MDPVTILGLTAGGTLSVGKLLDKLLGPSVEAIGGGIASPLIAWKEQRVKRASDILTAAAAAVDQAGHELHPVPGRILWPILEMGSLEDDHELRSTWTRLLANAADPSTASEVLPAFVHILGELSSIEVKILNWIGEHGDHDQGIYELRPEDVMQDLDLTWPVLSVIIGNLERLNLITRPMGIIPSLTAGQRDVGHYSGTMYITPLGGAFVNACTREERAERPSQT